MNQAIITGVNDYKYSPYDRLRGCVEDAQNFNLLAQNYLGFEPDEVVLLLDSQATAARIRNAVELVVSRAHPGERVLWTHSSHGTNNLDPTQADGFEELLCCYDTRAEASGQWDLSTLISAKFIGQVIAQLHPEAHMDIIIDACYAPDGSQLKAMGRSYSKARFLWSPAADKVMASSAGGRTKMPPNVCLWSACEPHQTSADAYIDNRWQGAFSAAFRKFFKIGRSRNDMIFYSKKWLKDSQYDQIPHLYGVGLAGEPLAR